MSKEIIYNADARLKMKSGIDKVANAVKVTLGPKGRNVVIKKNWGAPDVTKDGVTVAKEISLKDAAEDAGAQLCKQVATRANDIAGDGTTTATVLAQAMIENGIKHISSGANPVAIKKGIDKAVADVLAFVSDQKVDLTLSQSDLLRAVATISGNDSEVGELVTNAYIEAGENGIVTFEETKGTTGSTLTVTQGFEFDRGFLSPYFATSSNQQKCEYEDPLILLWGSRIRSAYDMLNLLNSVAKSGKPLLIVADDVELEPLSMLVLNKLNGAIQVVAVKCPGYGERQTYLMQDIALLTGATYFSEDMGKKLDSVSVTDLGSAKRVIVTKDSCAIIEGGGKAEELEKHTAELKKLFKEATSPFDQEKYAERIAKLSGAVSIIKIGAAAESELKEKKYRYEDAISAVKAALDQGVVPGGGTTLARAAESISTKADNSDEQIGIEIVKASLSKPCLTILENAGVPLQQQMEVLNRLRKSNVIGYDGLKNGEEVKDMITRGIVDPVKVVKCALESAAAIAGLFLTTEAIIVDIPEDEKSTPNPYAGMM